VRLSTITPQFVELIPREIQEGILYISAEYGTASHMCCCGCGMKVVTSLSPARWQLYREGDLVTLHPSIGNWDFPCRSHYWIRRNRVIWAGRMSKQKIQRVKVRDKRDIERYIAQANLHKSERASAITSTKQGQNMLNENASLIILWHRLKTWIGF